MAVSIRIKDVIDKHFGDQDCGYAEDYFLFRAMEDWCLTTLDRSKWRFDYSSTICVCGIDLPNRIIFYVPEDLVMFKITFGI